jgi:hypothetical protein
MELDSSEGYQHLVSTTAQPYRVPCRCHSRIRDREFRHERVVVPVRLTDPYRWPRIEHWCTISRLKRIPILKIFALRAVLIAD